MQRGERGPGHEAGFTYIGLLVLVALIGLMLSGAGEVARTAAQRERETELLFIGHQYRDAIGRYFAHNGRYPQSLDELIGSTPDDRLPVHYLRRLYRDPMTRTTDWVLVPAPATGIMGVASASTGAPLKHAGFDSVDLGFEDAQTYQDWVFRFDARGRRWPLAGPGAAPGVTPPH